jgi:hypothetical protein
MNNTPVLYDEEPCALLRSRMDNGAAVPAGWVRFAERICHLASGHPTEPLLN